jgi:hypothetical protein
MFHTIMKLFEKDNGNGKYIYFGASIIYCDEKNVCMVYYPDTSVLPVRPAQSVEPSGPVATS